MKRFLLGIVSVLILLLSIVYFIVNSSYFITLLAEKYLPSYKISYSRVDGNPLSGVTIYNINFDGKYLAKNLSIRINPFKLSAGIFTISKLHLLGVDVDNLERMLKFLSSYDSEDDKSSSIEIPITLEFSGIKLTLLPFKRFGVNFQKELVDIESIVLSGNSFRVGKIAQLTESSIGDIYLKGSFDNGVVEVDSLDVRRVDVDAILRIVKVNKEGDKNGEKIKDKNSSTVPIEVVKIKKFALSTLSYSFSGINISSKLFGEGLNIDLQKKKFFVDRLKAKVSSNLTDLSIDLRVDDEKIDIKNLLVHRFNIEKSLAFVSNLKGEESGKKDSKGDKKSIPFLPDKILIDEFDVTTLPYKKDKLKIGRAKFVGSGIKMDSLNPKSGLIVAKVDSNLFYLQLKAEVGDGKLSIDKRKSYLKLKDALFNEYKLPLKRGSFSPIVFKGEVDRDGVKLYSGFIAKDILKDKTLPKVDIKGAVLRLSGNFESGKFILNGRAKLSLPFAKKIDVTSKVDLKSMNYIGKIVIPKLSLQDEKVSKLLGRVKILLKGSKKSFVINLESRKIRAKMSSRDFKKAKISVWSNSKIGLAHYVDIPKEIKSAYVKIKLSTEMDLTRPLPLKGDFKILSNLVDTKGRFIYDKRVLIKAISRVPKNTILHRFDKNIKFRAIGDVESTLKYGEKTLLFTTKSKIFSMKLLKTLKNSNLKGSLSIGRTVLRFQGDYEKILKGDVKISSLKSFIKDVKRLYKLETPDIDGDLTLNLEVDRVKSIKLSLNSKRVSITGEDKKDKYIKGLKATIFKTGNSISIKRYSLLTEGLTIFAKKESKIELTENSSIYIKRLWINDSLKIEGKFSPKKRKGSFRVTSKSFNLDHKFIQGKISANIKVKIIGDRINIDGKVVILNGKVKYKIAKRKYVSDSDVVIVQRQQKGKKSDDFKKNIKIYLLLSTKKALLFKNRDLKVELSPELSISKEYNGDLQILGSVNLKRGGYYRFENKKFVLQKSSVYFTGRPDNPILNIHLLLNRYNRRVKIYVAGEISEPSLNFSSEPVMSREQILSFILFDDENAVNSSSMVSALGGALAKSILRNIGIKIDSMVIKSGGFEIGKKISKKVTIIYDQSDRPKAILRIEHSNRLETDISVGEESQSVDITYKKEF